MLTTLPPELVLLVLQQLPPEDDSTLSTLRSTSLVSSTFLAISRSNALWRPINDRNYHQHRPPSPAVLAEAERTASESSSPAFRYFALRRERDDRIRALVRQAQTPLSRIPLVELAREDLGADAIEALRPTRNFTEDKRPETWLSLQYWARTLRTTLLRDEAVRFWIGMVERDEAGAEAEDDFERGLNAFAAFRGLDPLRLPRERFDMVLHQPLVRDTANLVGDGVQKLEELAHAVMTYMQETLRLGPAADGSFHDLENHYVELVWRRAESGMGGSLPMTLVAIFCSLVRRLPVAQALKIRVRPIGFPGTVLAGLSFDGSDEWVYVNVFAQRILSKQTLVTMLRAMGQSPAEHFFQPATAREMCLRVARNILTSVRNGDAHRGEPISHNDALSSLYSVAHALFLLTPLPGSSTATTAAESAEAEDERRTYSDWLVSLCQAEFPLDVGNLERLVVPTLPPARRERVEALCQAIRQDDRTEKEQKWVSGEIKWPIGHVFRHRLFGYVAVVRGWDYKCEASEQWIRQMRVDTLPHGRSQPFYHVIVDDGSSRYVASENITTTPLTDGEVDQFLAHETLGRYFRKRERVPQEGGGGTRWQFVPSWETQAEYPDS
ncbi:hypothetical protein JCM10207_002727 [Rhodosporidiobolus poonsookiae]